jgi:hypothetical protein
MAIRRERWLGLFGRNFSEASGFSAAKKTDECQAAEAEISMAVPK